MDEPDFSGIDPLRLPEARRRVALIEEYMALPSKTTADAVAFGARIGLSRFQFARLVRAWREHRQPRLLVVGRRGPATRDYGIDPRAAEIARGALEESGPDAELATVAPVVEARCAEAGVTPPSRPTLWTWLRKARAAGATPAGGPPRIVVGRLWFHLPVIDAAPGDMPTALVAMLLPERRIVAHLASADEARPPAVADLVDLLVAGAAPGAPARPLLIEADDRRMADSALARSGLGGVRPHARSVQREIGRAVGGRLGTLAALHRRGSARPETRRVVQRQDERIAPAAALAAIDAAVAAHNVRLPDPAAPFAVARR